MTLEQIKTIHRTGLVCAAGLCLLYVVVLVPHAGDADGKSFFTVANNSPWHQPGDWPAAWCSLKIILFGAGLSILLASFGIVLDLLKREAAAASLCVLAVGQSLVCLFGIYCLIKAVL